MNKHFVIGLLGLMVVASAPAAEQEQEGKKACFHRLYEKYPVQLTLAGAATFFGGFSVARVSGTVGWGMVAVGGLVLAKLEHIDEGDGFSYDIPRVDGKARAAADVFTGRRKGS